jgi:hypothetical protein
MNTSSTKASVATPQAALSAAHATAPSADRDPLDFDAVALERSLRHVHGAALDDVLTPRPFPSAAAPFRLDPEAPHAGHRSEPWARALAELAPAGRLPPGLLGADVPLAEELAVTAMLDGWSVAHAHARRWVSRIMRLTSRDIDVHPTHTIVAHLGLAWAAHHDGKRGERDRAACVARFAAALPSGAGGLGTAAFVRAAKLFALVDGGLDAAGHGTCLLDLDP